ncbi:MAG: ABC transporter ATP-binding protein [Pseudomonadota bacterium]
MNRAAPYDPERDPLINVVDLNKTYTGDEGEIQVLKGINLKVYPGEMAAIMGPSGSGKSTLLYILGLFLSPTNGVFRFAGEDMLALSRSGQAEYRRRKVGFVFQNADLLENSTVYENLEFPLIYAGVKKRYRKDLIHEALELVNLGHRINHPSNKLSGGERQRVAISRALVNKPPAILADEPTGALDADNTRVVMGHFKMIMEKVKTAIVMVTHDPQVAANCTKVFFMDNGMLQEKKAGDPRLARL